MATALSNSDLEQAREMINAGDLTGFYDYMAAQGYTYAYLGGSLVAGDNFSGSAAVNYLIETAASQGVTISTSQLPAIENDMANKWVDALEKVADSEGTVSSDLSFAGTMAFHALALADFGLTVNAWTLAVPAQVLGGSTMESDWTLMLDELANNPNVGALGSEFLLTAQMAIIGAVPSATSTSNSAAANAWLVANADNAFSDSWALAVKKSTPANLVSIETDGNLQISTYSDNADSVVMTSYTETLQKMSGKGYANYTVTENVFALPVGSTSIVSTALSDEGLVVNASSTSNALVSSDGSLFTSGATILAESSATPTDNSTSILSVSGDGNILRVTTAGVSAALLGDNEQIFANQYSGEFSMSGTGDEFTGDYSKLILNSYTTTGVQGSGDIFTLYGGTDFALLVGDSNQLDLGVASSFTITSQSSSALVSAGTGAINVVGTDYNVTAVSGILPSASSGATGSYSTQQVSIGSNGNLSSVQASDFSSTDSGISSAIVSEDGSGNITGITTESSGQAATVSNSYGADGLLESTTSVGPHSTTITTYNDPSDLNIRTVKTINDDGSVTIVTTAKDANGNYTVSATDGNGNPITPPNQPSPLLTAETGVQDVLQIYRDITSGQPVAATDSAINLAKFLENNKNVTLNKLGDGADAIYSVENLVSAIKNGNAIEGIRDGTMLVSDFVSLFSKTGTAGPGVGYAVDVINFAADLSEKNYAGAAVDVLEIISPELAAAIEIYQLLSAIFGNHQDITVGPLSADAAITLDAGTPTEHDTVSYAQNSSSEHRLSLVLGEGDNTITTGDGGLALHADAKVGQDVITVNHAGDTTTTRTLTFDRDVDLSDVVWKRDGDDVTISTNMGGSITIKNWFSNGAQAISSVTFSDGTVWTKDNNPGVTLYQTADADSQDLNGAIGFNNVISTRTFNDVVDVDSGALNTTQSDATIIGGTGSDNISIGSSTQFEIATMSGNDSITVSGLNNSGAIYLGSGSSSVAIQAQYNSFASDISIDLGTGNNNVVDGYEYTTYHYESGGGNDTITIAEESETQDFASMKSIVFAQGISESDLTFTRVGEDLLVGTGPGNGSLTIAGWFAYADTKIGSFQFFDGSSLSIADLKDISIPYHGDGDLEGWDGNDDLFAGSGDDTLVTNGGTDILHGGSGNDTFNVTAGSDATVITGDGNDSVSIESEAIVTLGSGADTVSVNEGLVSASIYAGSGNDQINVGATVSEDLASIYAGTGSLSISGDASDSSLKYSRGDGSVVVDALASNASGEATQIESLIFQSGIATSDVSATRNGDSLILGIAGQSGTIEFVDWFSDSQRQGMNVTFSDGTSLSGAVITQALTSSDGATVAWNGVVGTSGNDSLTGLYSNEVFDGLGGQDQESGYQGNDTFIFDAGYGSLEIREASLNASLLGTLQLGAGIDVASVVVRGDSSGDLVLTDGVSGDSVMIDSELSASYQGVGKVEFADGTVWDRTTLVAMATTGTTGADSLTGTPNAEVIDGKGGNDTVNGDGGSDTFVYDSGYGALDIVNSYSGGSAPILSFGPGITEADLKGYSTGGGDNLVITDGVSGDQITIDWMMYFRDYGVTGAQFADGSTMSLQQLLSLATTGTSGNDTLYGSSIFSDTFDGHGGNDEYISYGGSDTYIFDSEYGHLEINSHYNGGDAPVLSLGEGITESNLVVRSDRFGDLLITDGVAGDQITVDDEFPASNMGVTSVVLSDGTSFTAAQLQAMTTVGNAGADSLVGTSGADVIDGKGGNDTVNGNGGSDTFVYDAGYGALEINNSYSDGNLPVLSFGAGITAADIKGTSASYGENLVITDGVAGDQITIDWMLYFNDYGVTGAEFADGSTMSLQQLMNLPTTGTSGNDTITGKTNSEYFDGRGGQDVEIGGGGNDTYALDSGYGAVTVENGTSSNNSAAGMLSIAGEDASNIWFRQVGNDLEVDVMGTDTKATLQGWFSSDASKLSSVAVSGGSDGSMTIDTGLNQLIQAMASYSIQNPGFDPRSSANSSITDSGLLVQVTADWHR